jgi:hypothetical protein
MVSSLNFQNFQQTVLSPIHSITDHLSKEQMQKIILFVHSFFFVQTQQEPQSGVIEINQDEEFKDVIPLLKLYPPQESALTNALSLEEYRTQFNSFSPAPATIPITSTQEAKQAYKQIEKDLKRDLQLSLDNQEMTNKKEIEEKMIAVPREKYTAYLDHLHQGLAYYLCQYLEKTFVNQNLNIYCAFGAYSIKIKGNTNPLSISGNLSCELLYVAEKGIKKPVFEEPVSLEGKIEIDFSVKDIQAVVFCQIQNKKTIQLTP